MTLKQEPEIHQSYCQLLLKQEPEIHLPSFLRLPLVAFDLMRNLNKHYYYNQIFIENITCCVSSTAAVSSVFNSLTYGTRR